MTFLVIDDDKTFRDATCFVVEEEGHEADGADSGAVGLQRLSEERFDAAFLDLQLGAENGLDILAELHKRHPNLPVVMITGQGNVKTAVEAMRRGAVDFLEKPFRREQFHTVLARLQRLQKMGQQIEKLERDVTETKAQNAETIFDFTTSPMREVMETLGRAAATPATILILGESGAGKSVAARAVHERSHLADKPFVTVSCPSLSRELLESELFGHMRGSFTGAVKDHWGKVKAAEGGTLFLDEIGDLPLEIQPKLLRLLQEREYERLGENIPRRANVRIIAATNRDLKKRVSDGSFREDLFFRLNVITVEMPPLRQRANDILRFAVHYQAHFAAQCGRKLSGFSEDALAFLLHHPWPGNLRELRNAIERAVIMARGSEVTADDLPRDSHLAETATETGAATDALSVGSPVSLEKLEEAHIRAVLQKAGGLSEAAAVLGIDQATLYRKRKKLGLE